MNRNSDNMPIALCLGGIDIARTTRLLLGIGETDHHMPNVGVPSWYISASRVRSREAPCITVESELAMSLPLTEPPRPLHQPGADRGDEYVQGCPSVGSCPSPTARTIAVGYWACSTRQLDSVTATHQHELVRWNDVAGETTRWWMPTTNGGEIIEQFQSELNAKIADQAITVLDWGCAEQMKNMIRLFWDKYPFYLKTNQLTDPKLCPVAKYMIFRDQNHAWVGNGTQPLRHVHTINTETGQLRVLRSDYPSPPFAIGMSLMNLDDVWEVFAHFCVERRQRSVVMKCGCGISVLCRLPHDVYENFAMLSYFMNSRWPSGDEKDELPHINNAFDKDHAETKKYQIELARMLWAVHQRSFASILVSTKECGTQTDESFLWDTSQENARHELATLLVHLRETGVDVRQLVGMGGPIKRIRGGMNDAVDQAFELRRRRCELDRAAACPLPPEVDGEWDIEQHFDERNEEPRNEATNNEAPADRVEVDSPGVVERHSEAPVSGDGATPDNRDVVQCEAGTEQSVEPGQYGTTVLERLVPASASTHSGNSVTVADQTYRCAVGCHSGRMDGYLMACGHAVHRFCLINICRANGISNGYGRYVCPLCRAEARIRFEGRPRVGLPSLSERAMPVVGSINQRPLRARGQRPSAYIPAYPRPDYVTEGLVGHGYLHLFPSLRNGPCGRGALFGLAQLLPPEEADEMRRRIDDYLVAHVNVDGNQIEIADIIRLVIALELPFGVYAIRDVVPEAGPPYTDNLELLRGAVPGLGVYLLPPRPVPRRVMQNVDTHYVPGYAMLGRLDGISQEFAPGQRAFLRVYALTLEAHQASWGTNSPNPDWERWARNLNEAASGHRCVRPTTAPGRPSRERTGAVVRALPSVDPVALAVLRTPETTPVVVTSSPANVATAHPTAPTPATRASTSPNLAAQQTTTERSPTPTLVVALSDTGSTQPSRAAAEAEPPRSCEQAGIPDPDPAFERVGVFEEYTDVALGDEVRFASQLGSEESAGPGQVLAFIVNEMCHEGEPLVEHTVPSRPPIGEVRGLPSFMIWVGPRPPPVLTRHPAVENKVRWHWVCTNGGMMDRPDVRGPDLTVCKCMNHGNNYCRHLCAAMLRGRYVLCCGHTPTALMMYHPRLFIVGLACAQDRLTTHYAGYRGRLEWGCGEGDSFDALPHPYTVSLGRPTDFWAIRRADVMMTLLKKKKKGAIRNLITTCVEEGGLRQMLHGAVVGVAMETIGRCWDLLNIIIGAVFHTDLYTLVTNIIGILLMPIMSHNPLGIVVCMMLGVLCIFFIVKNAIARYYWRLTLTTRCVAIMTGGLLFCAIELLRTWAHPDPALITRRAIPTDVVQSCLHPGLVEGPFTQDVATRLNHRLTLEEASGIIRASCCRNDVIIPTRLADRAIGAAGTLQDHYAVTRMTVTGSACHPKTRGGCKSCGVALRGQGKMKYMLCRNCLKCLPETRGTYTDPPRFDPDVEAIRLGAPETGPVPLMPIWSCPLPPPAGTATMFYDGNCYRTTFNYSRAETQSCAPVQIRGVGVGVLHPRHFPHVQPRGPAALALGLDCRMFSEKTSACGASWAAVETLDHLLMERVWHKRNSLDPLSFQEWWRSQERKEDMLKAKLDIELNGYEPLMSRAGVFGKAQWNKGWEEVDGLFQPITEFKPRIIVAPDDRHHVTLGPWIVPVQALLKEAWPVEGPIAYMGAATPEMMDAYATRLHMYHLLGYAFILGDMSQFETTKSMASNAHTHKIMRLFWNESQHDGQRDLCLKWQLNPTFRATCGGETFVGQTTNCLPSGVPNTTLSNNLDSGFTHATACICGLLRIHPSAIPLQPKELLDRAYRACHVGVAGDDSVTAVPREFSGNVVDMEVFSEYYAAAIKALGFKPKLEIVEDIRKIVFLGCRLYQCTSNGVTRRRWGPTLGRRLYKHHFCLDLVGNPFDWLATVSDMEVRCYSHVPILYDIAVRVRDLVGKPRPLRRVMIKRMRQNELYTVQWEKDHNWHYTEQTLLDICEVYGVGRADLEDLLNAISKINTVPYVLSHPVLERFFSVDDH